MAWVAITNNPNWQYNNSPEDPGAGSPLRALWLKQTNGIRTIGSGAGAHQVYSEVRRVGDTTNRSRGELSKSYWDAREGTLSSYAVNNFDPKLVFDFTGNVFKTGGGISTFSNSVTHARAGQATMVDSDGLLKWAPHNLLKFSEDYSGNGWFRTAYTVTPNNDLAPDGTTTANLVSTTSGSASYLMDDGYAFTNTGNYTLKVWAKANTGDSTLRVWLWMLGGSSGSPGTTTFNLTNEWQLLEINATITTSGAPRIRIDQPNAGASTFYLWGAHAYRSDLGGMVNNSAQSTGFETYVPTTNSAVYAPRVGHHVYNGSAWVNEGILHESEARTNLLTSSGDVSGTGWTGSMTRGAVTAGSPLGTYQTISPVSNGIVDIAIRYQLGKTLTSGATYVTSSLVKYSAGSGWFILRPYDTGLGGRRAWFDLQNGVVGTKDADVLDYGMIDYGDGWWLCWASDNVSSTSGGFIVEVPNSNGGFSASADDVILIAGTQYEQGTTPSSYIPTTSSTVTRAAETLTVPAANLPWPTPVVIGSELVTNGTFDSNTNNWTAFNSTLSVDSNRLKIVNDGIFGSATHQFTTVSNKVYLVTADLIYGGAVDGRILINEGQFGGSIYSALDTMASFDKTFSIVFKAVSHLTNIVLQNAFGTSGGFGSTGGFNFWDNVSIKEINPLALSIQMDGRMTYADNSQLYEVSHYFWNINSSNRIVSALQTTGSFIGKQLFEQRDAGEIDSVTGTNTDYSPGINVPFNISARHGSTFVNGSHEGTLLTANTTPTALPDLSSTNLLLGYIFMGTIAQFRVWDNDLTDAGIVEATEPSTEPSLQLTFDGSSTNSFTVLDWSE